MQATRPRLPSKRVSRRPAGGRRRRAAALAGGWLLALSIGHAGEWWNRAWTFRQTITVDARTIDSDLADFPLRLQLDDARFARTLAAADGRDLRAVTSKGEVLPIEIVKWSPNDVRLTVRVPRLAAGAAHEGFALYFGNARAPSQAAGLVWSGRHAVVAHLSGDVTDASVHRAPIAREGYVVQNGWTPGLVMEQSQPWITFDRAHRGFLEIPVPGGSTAVMLAGRFRTTAAEEKATLFSAAGFNVEAAGSRVVLRSQDSTLTMDDVKPGGWHSVVVSADAVTGARQLWVDGRPAAHGVVPAGSLAEKIRVGRALSDAADTQFAGEVEEVRVASGPRTPAWLKAVALNLSDANPLVMTGPLERADGAPALPAPPQLLGPVADSESYKPGGIELRWLPALGAEAYDVLIFDQSGRQPVGRLSAGPHPALPLTSERAGRTDLRWTVAARSRHGETQAKEQRRLTFHRAEKPEPAPLAATAAAPVLRPAEGVEIELRGYFGDRIARLKRYLLAFDTRNPGILRMLRERPEKNIPPWAGVFPGQYLSSMEQVWRLTRDPELRAHSDAFVRALVSSQRADGYLGPFEGIGEYLGLWNHYAVLTGLLDYHEDTNSEAALGAARRIGDLVLRTYGPAAAPLPKNGGANEAVVHALVRLGRATGDVRYRDFARYVINEAWNEPGGVAYHRLGRERAGVADFPVRRWEGVHNLMALSEMYWFTGQSDYAADYAHLWRVLGRTERHATGGFSTNEGLLGTPYNRGTIETCSTVAWTLLSTDMLKLTGESRAADELEWSTLNSALGSIPFDGTCSTYATQPDGLRQFNVLHQGPPDGGELSCCSTNAARALGNLANWALMQRDDGLVLNFYGPSKLAATSSPGHRVSLDQQTDYPAGNVVRLKLALDAPDTFTLHLRIPAWSTRTRVTVNGEPPLHPAAGTYLPLHRRWRTGDEVLLELDFTPRCEAGREDYAGQVCIFRGPLLYSSDARYAADHQPFSGALNLDRLQMETLPLGSEPGPWVRARLTDGDGTEVILCDFSSAGLFGEKYRSWLQRKDPAPARSP